MKQITILLLMLFSIIGCGKDDSPKPATELDKLPPATQIGANRLGCLLDGKAFMPGSYNNSTNCFYQYVNGGYYFNVNFNNTYNGDFKGVMVGTEGLQINENQTLELFERTDGNAFGLLMDYITPYYTTHTHPGELKITKLDQVNGIVSGTFWYDVEDKDGVVHQIREGRFDMQYTN